MMMMIVSLDYGAGDDRAEGRVIVRVSVKPNLEKLYSCHALYSAPLPVRPAADQIWPAATAAPAYTTSFSDHILPIS